MGAHLLDSVNGEAQAALLVHLAMMDAQWPVLRTEELWCVRTGERTLVWLPRAATCSCLDSVTIVHQGSSVTSVRRLRVR